MISVTAFPAREGDCILVEYGSPEERFRILVDGGRLATYHDHLKPFLAGLPDEGRRLDLLVVTHVDRDHIEGALALAEDVGLDLAVGDVWFNGYPHLIGGSIPVLAPRDGELLGAAIRKRKWPWNNAFNGGPVSLGSGEAPVTRELPGGALVRLLSPDAAKLKALAPTWERECMRAGLIPGALAGGGGGGSEMLPVLGPRTSEDLSLIAARTTAVDTAVPNGSSIAFMLEVEGVRILLAADAHPDRIATSLALHYGPAPVLVDLFKVSHHGSRANVTQKLCQRMQVRDALVSTNGAMFKHPDEEAIARIVTPPGMIRTLHFNYENDITRSWNDPALGGLYRFGASYSAPGQDGLYVLSWTGDRFMRSDLWPVTAAML